MEKISDAEYIPGGRLTNLYINPTRFCNLKCQHCWLSPPVKDELTKENDEISINEMIAIIKEAQKLGLRGIKLTGGEPLLRKDLKQLLSFCNDVDLKVDIETNGTLITRDVARMMHELNVNFISVSLDSFNEDLNDFFRGKKGAFKSAIDGIRYLIEEYYPPQVILSLYRENMENFGKYLDLMRGMGVNDIKINVISPVGRAEALKKKGNILTVEEILDFSEEVKALSGSFKGRVYLDLPLAFKGFNAIAKGGCGMCRIKNILGLLSDGSISICGIGYLEGDLLFGNVREKPELLKEIWAKNDTLNTIRNDMVSQLEGVCGICVFKNVCLGSCRAEVYHNSKSLFAPYWFCQEAYEKGLFPSIKLLPESLRT